MFRRVLVINGHPDPRPERFCAALAAVYADGAREAGHEVRTLALGTLDAPLIATRDDFENGAPPAAILGAQADIQWAQHIVLIHPLWLGGAPALVKGFLEQAFRYGFALPKPGSGFPKGLLSGRSVRTIVTMGMPAAVYRLVFGAFGVRAIERGVFGLAGLSPIRHLLIGGVEALNPAQRRRRLEQVRRLGAEAA
jgi:putative NADPH-quinone reductase